MYEGREWSKKAFIFIFYKMLPLQIAPFCIKIILVFFRICEKSLGGSQAGFKNNKILILVKEALLLNSVTNCKEV